MKSRKKVDYEKFIHKKFKRQRNAKKRIG